MKLLLDTHLLLWAAGKSDRLSADARELILDPDNQPIFSSASLWEITIKVALGRSDFKVSPRRLWRLLLANGYKELQVNSEHAIAVGGLPPVHKDPFDRILVAQSKVEEMTLMTSDPAVADYGEGILKV